MQDEPELAVLHEGEETKRAVARPLHDAQIRPARDPRLDE